MIRYENGTYHYFDRNGAELHDGDTVPIKNPNALAQAILQLYNDRELTHRMAINSLHKAKEYKPEIVLADFYNVIESKSENG